MKINEVSQQVGLSIDTIRYYEKIGIIGPVPRNNGIRDFGERSVNQLQFAKVMRKAGVKIEKLQTYLKYIYEDDDRTISDRRQLLVDEANRIQLQINDLVDAHEYLQYKIDNYYGHMRDAEKSIKK